MRSARLVRRLSTAAVVLTVALQAWGGFVHATGSSLACPDWPLCHGQVMPAMVGGVAIEHGHRLLAAAVVGLTVLLLLATHRRRARDRRSWRLAWAALGLVLVQAVLGGATVLLGLSPPASTLHLAVSMMLLFTFTALALRHLQVLGGSRTRPSATARLRTALSVVLALLFVQIVLGGLVRHTGASMACGREVLLCRGDAWPGAGLLRLHMLHRFGGLVVGAAVLGVGGWAGGRGRATDAALAGLAVVLVAGQIGLGLWSVAGALPVTAVTLHLAVAAALFVVWTALWWRAGGAASVAQQPAGEADPPGQAEQGNEPGTMELQLHGRRTSA